MLTSNATRELSEAVRRRCLYLHIDYPDAEREHAIVISQVPGIEDRLARVRSSSVAGGCGRWS